MAAQKLTDEQFIELWGKFGSASELAHAAGMHIRNVHTRRREIEAKGIPLIARDRRTVHYYTHIEPRKHPARAPYSLYNGTVLVFSDAHFWPGVRTTAFKGLLAAIEGLKPSAIINNGDAFDGASISRHPRIGWDSKPSVIEELKACKNALDEIEEYAKDAKLFWPLGNHCARFETFLAANAPQYEGVPGFTLKDHFPKWTPCWSTWINDGEAVVKHRYKNGVHATHNNTVNAGKTIITGHLHSLKVTPYDDYNGTRWGVDTGTLAEPGGPQFVDYMEDNPSNWRSGFVALTFHKGELLWPEIIRARQDGCIEFRGQIVDVSKY